MKKMGECELLEQVGIPTGVGDRPDWGAADAAKKRAAFRSPTAPSEGGLRGLRGFGAAPFPGLADRREASSEAAGC